MQTHYTVFFFFFPNLIIPDALSRKVNSVQFVVSSFGYSCGSSDAPASVFVDTSVSSNRMSSLSTSSSHESQLFLPHHTYPLPMQVVQPVVQFFLPVNYCLCLLKALESIEQKLAYPPPTHTHTQRTSNLLKFFNAFAIFRAALHKFHKLYFSKYLPA